MKDRRDLSCWERPAKRACAVAAVALCLASCGAKPPRPPRPLISIDGLDPKLLHATVSVVLDVYGIPHIFAASREDAAFALGWFHARDRLLQMDIYRRAGLGRLSEILGPAALEEDRFARLLGLHRAARASWARVPKDSIDGRILIAYANGVNQYIARASPQRLPEFYARHDLKPEAWEPEHCFAVQKRFSAELSHSFDDVYLQLVAEKLGPEAAEALFPAERDARVPVVREPRGTGSVPGVLRSSSSWGAAGEIEAPCRDVLARFGGIEPRIAARGARASNAWAVSGRLSADGLPILCGDPHLGFSHPSTFFSAQLHSPGLSVVGITLPGLPPVIFGHNGSIAWAGTNAQIDVTDFYVETLDPQSPGRYLHRGVWRQIERIEETIAVRGRESESLVVERTVRGPIVHRHGKALSMRWIGERASGELSAFIALNAAHGLQGFLDAQRSYVAPAMALVYADVNGNIAVRAAGQFPRRLRGLGRVPADGASGDYEWGRPLPFEEVPFSVNPAEGYIVSANQRLTPPGFPHYSGWEFDPSFRARRIDELLSASRQHEPRRMRELQLDVQDLALRELLPLLVAAFGAEAPPDPIASHCLRLLRAWDCRVRPDTEEPTIAWRWLEAFADHVWEDEWARANLPTSESWGFASNGWRPPMDLLVQLSIAEPKARWFDDVRTEEIEDRDAILRRSFLAAVKSLAADFGPNVSSWVWGQINQMAIPAIDRAPERTLALGPVPGSAFTVCPGGSGGAVTAGAVYRLVMPLGDLSQSRGAGPGVQACVPSGESPEGLALKQVKAYLNGSLFPLYDYSHPGDFPDHQVHQLIILSPAATLPPARSDAPAPAVLPPGAGPARQ
jgi:penicillin amidase